MKRLALGLMRDCGMFALARVLSVQMARILMYHNFAGPGESDGPAISAAAMRKQLGYLRRHFHVVPLSRIFEQLKAGRRLDGLNVVLTIDDGRRNCYEFLFPLLKEFEMPATFFVVSSFIRGEDWLWTDKVLWLGEQPSRPDELAPGKIEAFFAQLNQLRPEARNLSIEALAVNMGVSIPSQPPAKYAPCSWRELREMADTGLVEIGSHTVTHPILASITEEESWRELTLSRAQIEEGMSRPINSFCFPNGKTGDYRPSQLRQVRDAGYEGAVTAEFGMVANRANPYEVPRIGIGGDSDTLSFSKEVDGVEYFQARARQSFRLRGAHSRTQMSPNSAA